MHISLCLNQDFPSSFNITKSINISGNVIQVLEPTHIYHAYQVYLQRSRGTYLGFIFCQFFFYFSNMKHTNFTHPYFILLSQDFFCNWFNYFNSQINNTTNSIIHKKVKIFTVFTQKLDITKIFFPNINH